MTSTLFLNKRQTLLINKFQLNTFSKPAHVLLHIGDYVYIHLRTTLPSQHTESGFQVKPVTLDTADHDFGCCKPMRDALVPRLGSFSDDTILCSTNLEQSGISSSCYVATGDERELPEMIEYGGGDWVLAVLEHPSPRSIVEPILLRVAPIDWYYWGLPYDSLSAKHWLCTWLKGPLEAAPDPFFKPHDHKYLAGAIMCILALPLTAIKPIEIRLEKRFVALALDWCGLGHLEVLAIRLTNFSYGSLVYNAFYHEAIRHSRKCLLEILPAHATEWLKEVIPEQRRSYSIVSRLGTEVEIDDHEIDKGIFVGVTGEHTITHCLIMKGLRQRPAWVIPLDKIKLPFLLSAVRADTQDAT